MATDLQSAPFVHLGTCPNIAKSLDSALYAQKQTIPLTVLPLSNRPAGDYCSGWRRQLFWKQAILRRMSRYVKWDGMFFLVVLRYFSTLFAQDSMRLRYLAKS